MTILVINGPNLNLLGQRAKQHYGAKTLDEINKMLQDRVNELVDIQVQLKFFQSNCEGALIDFVQKNFKADGLIINPGALTHYSYALADALRDFPGKKVEVHLSDIGQREDWRAKSVTGEACNKVIIGKKEQGYVDGLEWILEKLRNYVLKCK
jgi:3-dehydroquinate dehydratase-2